MLKKIKNLNGITVLSKNEQIRLIAGGAEGDNCDLRNWGWRCYQEETQCTLYGGIWHSNAPLSKLCGYCEARERENSSF